MIEHLLFTGSRNFPEDHQIEKIVNKYNGEQNGVTKAFTTSYMFRIDDNGLEEFIPALVDAVKEPTFTIENIKKEINNVNSEISMRMTYNKSLAYYKLLKAIGNPESKIYSDGFANIDSAKWNLEELREQIVDFHSSYYSANIMTLTILSEAPMEDVRRLVETYFSTIPNKEVERPLFNNPADNKPPLVPETFGTIYHLMGFTEPSKFRMVFQLNSEKFNPHFHSLEFFSMFLNYFSENSFKQTLIKKSLISSFHDSIALQDYVNALYTIEFNLTPNGKKNISKIVKYFFRFVNFVKQIPDKQAIFETFSRTSKYAFLFNIKSKYVDFTNIEQDLLERTVDFSEILQDFEPEMLFTVNNILFKYDEHELNRNLEFLTPDNAVYVIESSSYKVDEEVKISGEAKMREENAKSIVERDAFSISNLKKRSHRRNTKTESPASRRLKVSVQTNEPSEKTLHEFFDTDFLARGFKGRSTNPLSYNNFVEFVSIKPAMSKLRDRALKASSSAIDLDDDVLDNAIDSVTLSYAFDFDNGRRYNLSKVPAKTFEAWKREVEAMTDTFETCKALDTQHLDYYALITTCRTPTHLRKSFNPRANSKSLLSAGDQTFDSAEEGKGLYTARVFDAVFSDMEGTPISLESRYTAVREMLLYKLCLVREFDDDDKRMNADLIYESEVLSVYHSLFRKTLQPKLVFSVTIESAPITETVMNTDFDTRLNLLLRMEVLCLYITNYVELRFHDEFMKANDFTCDISNYRMDLKFEGMSNQIENFAMAVLGELQAFASPATYEDYILDNFKQRIVDIYSQFNAITSLKLSTFYLNLIMDKIFIDNSSAEKVESIKALVHGIGAAQLAATMRLVLKDNKLQALSVGNIDTFRTLEISKRMRNILVNSVNPDKERVDSINYRKFMVRNFATQLPPKSHFMVRLPNFDKTESNSVYLTYFRIHKMSRSNKFKAFVLNHYLSKTVYQVLRNELNLGYVAQSGLKVYHHNLGLIVLVQGESFRPHQIEHQVDGMIQTFIQGLTGISEEEFEKVKALMLEQLTEFSVLLENIHEKYHHAVEEQILKEDDVSFEDISKSLTRESIQEFANEFFVQNQRRVTIELFASRVDEDEARFTMASSLGLGKKAYTITSLAEMAQLKAAASN